FMLFSMRGTKSPYEGSVWKTWKKASRSADSSTDYFMRAWSFPMAIVNHTTQLVNAAVFWRTEQAFAFLLGLPGEILGITGIYRQARGTRAVEEGRENPDVAANKTTQLGKWSARAKEALISPFGTYLNGVAISALMWMDANKLADPHVVECKHYAI